MASANGDFCNVDDRIRTKINCVKLLPINFKKESYNRQQTQLNHVVSPLHGTYTMAAKGDPNNARPSSTDGSWIVQSNQRIFPESHVMPNKRIVHATSP